MDSLAGRELSLPTQKEPVQLGINGGWAGYLCHLIFSLPVSLSPSFPAREDLTTPAKGQSHLES